MPLLTKMLPLRETVEDLQAVASLHSQHQQQRDSCLREEQDSGYEDFQEYNEDDDECLSSDMEGSIVHRGRPKKVVRAPPAIPARNEKRASKILENVMLELKALDGTSTKDTDNRSMIAESDPHESYLSSEEDASFSDDYEDSLASEEDSFDDTISPIESVSKTTRRRSQEDTARTVSIICVGKPHIVDIIIPSNHTSPVEEPPKRSSMNLDALTSLISAPSQPKSTRRPTPLKLYPSSIRRLSISSITSSHTSSSNSTAPTNTSSSNLPNTTSHTNNGALPPRKSSRLAHNLTALVTNTTIKPSFSTSYIPPSSSTAASTHSFLSSDPFSPNTRHTDEPITPKTPTSAAAAWKRGLSKTLNKAVRKPSLQKLSMAYGNSSVSNLGSQQGISSPQKDRESRRVSTSHSNYSGFNLARIPSELHLKEVDARSRSSVYSSYSFPQSQPQSQEPKDVGVRRSETFAGLASPRFAPDQSQQDKARESIRYDGVNRAPPPVPEKDNRMSGHEKGKRSFSFASGIGGLGRKKSVKAK